MHNCFDLPKYMSDSSHVSKLHTIRFPCNIAEISQGAFHLMYLLSIQLDRNQRKRLRSCKIVDHWGRTFPEDLLFAYLPAATCDFTKLSCFKKKNNYADFKVNFVHLHPCFIKENNR